ncbi:kinase-like domain-containing protein [Mycena epipterygia]|nr:kinase-like domain-containing protein [Mycena epipterygia]
MDVSMNGSSNVFNTSASDEADHTQPLSQPMDVVEDHWDPDSWALLIPCATTSGTKRVRFHKRDRQINIGRDAKNHIVLQWTCISGQHAVITWNGQANQHSEVTITDKSANGTFINGERIGKNMFRVLSDGNEISFGLARPAMNETQPEYRYIYRDLVFEERELYNKYDLSTELGQGAYARVYKALQRATSKWVAVKVIPQRIHHNPPPPTAGTRVFREIEIMRALRHPNICLLLDVFENPNSSVVCGWWQPFVIYQQREWAQYELTSFYVLSADGLQATGCLATSHIRSAKLSHTSIPTTSRTEISNPSAQNILLTKDKPPILKIADFGLSKLVDDATALRIVMRQSTESPYTSVVDSWSVGVIMFLILKGLFLSQTIEWAHLDSGKIEVAKKISKFGRAFLERLLVIDPETRMSLEDALYHPWLLTHKRTYELKYPSDDLAAGGSLSCTASLPSQGSNPSAPQQRAVTVDPYADDDPQLLQDTPTRAVTEDPYDEDLQLPNATNLRTSPSAPAPLETFAEIPGLQFVAPACPSTPTAQHTTMAGLAMLQRPEASGRKLIEPAAAIQQNSESFMYGSAPALVPGPIAPPAEVCEPPDGGARKRTFAVMHTADSSSLSSVESPPPAKKKGKSAKSTKAVPKPKGNPAAKPSSSKAKGKAKEVDIDNTTATRKSSRAARPVKRYIG